MRLFVFALVAALSSVPAWATSLEKPCALGYRMNESGVCQAEDPEAARLCPPPQVYQSLPGGGYRCLPPPPGGKP